MVPKIKIKVTIEPGELVQVIKSEQCYDIFRKIIYADSFAWYESFIMLCLNRSNKVIGYYKVSQGGVTGTVVDPKVIYTIALNCPGTTSIILCHNHPSGNTKPSESDIKITSKIVEAGRFLEIAVMDHLIISEDHYFSFADNGMI